MSSQLMHLCENYPNRMLFYPSDGTDNKEGHILVERSPSMARESSTGTHAIFPPGLTKTGWRTVANDRKSSLPNVRV